MRISVSKQEAKMQNKISAIVGLALVLCGAAWGHLDTAGFAATGLPASFSMQPAGPFTIGDTVIITYVVTMNHYGPTAAIAFSKDNGSTWESPDTMTISTTGKKIFKWVVPGNSVTTVGKIRVSYPGSWIGAATDASNIVSKTFIVQNASTLSSFAVDSRNLSDRQSGGFLLLSGFQLNGKSSLTKDENPDANQSMFIRP